MSQQHSSTQQMGATLHNYCCLFLYCHKKIHMNNLVVDPSFFGVLSFRCKDRILSVSKGGELLEFQEFNFSDIDKAF